MGEGDFFKEIEEELVPSAYGICARCYKNKSKNVVLCNFERLRCSGNPTVLVGPEVRIFLSAQMSPCFLAL